MTSDLADLLHRHADSVHFPLADLDAVAKAGDRRRRRRRAMSAAGGVAAVGVLVAGLQQLPSSPESTPVAAEGAGVSSKAAPVPQSWVTGSTLHFADGSTIDLGHEVASYVRTSSGFVFADAAGTVRSLVDGAVTEVGDTLPVFPRLYSDAESTLAGWVDPSKESAAYVVLDQATGSTTEYPAPRLAKRFGVGFGALDDGLALWSTGEGTVLVDLANGTETSVDTDSSAVTFEDGWIAAGVGATSADPGVELVHLDTKTRHRLEGASLPFGSFSPGATYFANDQQDSTEVYDVVSGQRMPLDLGGDYAWVDGYEWLDEGTLAVRAALEDGKSAPIRLLVCDVPAGTCEETASPGTFDEVVLPDGWGFADLATNTADTMDAEHSTDPAPEDAE